MRVLLDTCVLSEIRKPHGDQHVKRAVREISDSDLFISVISIGEIVKGMELLAEGKRKRDLCEWIQEIERDFPEAILGIDLDIVRIWGTLTASAQKSGKIIPACDGLIAATAKRHGLHIMTRNISDFKHTGAMIVNPWSK